MASFAIVHWLIVLGFPLIVLVGILLLARRKPGGTAGRRDDGPW